jgi:hypothetical protein
MIYLSESMVMQFSLGEVTGIIALVVSGFAIYISHFYTSRREQIKTSRYMWERINVRLDKIQEIANTKEWNKLGQKDIELKDLWPVVREIDYFAYLIVVDEIKDKVVLNYYKTPLSQYINSILKYYTIALIYYGFLIIKTLSIFLGACFKIR